MIIILTVLILSCKKGTKGSSEKNTISELTNSLIISANGDTIGTLIYTDSNNLYFSPYLDTLRRVFLGKKGVSKIGCYYNNLPHNNLLIFDEYSAPSKIEWYNLGSLYSEINNLKSEEGNVLPVTKSYIDTSLIHLPKTYITKSNKVQGKRRLTVYSESYPIYLMFFQYNVKGDVDTEYDFVKNSFILTFNQNQMDSDTLKITFNYLEDFVVPKERKIIKTLNQEIVID